jgi:ATPase subunit of ABC transporter with duplicated ATPase domains
MEERRGVDKPWQPWELRMAVEPRRRSGKIVARLDGAVIERGAFRLGPVDLEIGWQDRVAVVGRNGSGKSTLLLAILGVVPLAAGRRRVGPGVEIGDLDQVRARFTTPDPLLDAFGAATGLLAGDARTVLAKYGLGAAHVTRPAASLSPGERSRAQLAVLAATGVNCLVLDEPTNHLDLPAIEQLEVVLDHYPGTVVLVTHDRSLLERFRPTVVIDVEGLGSLPSGQ